MAVLPVVRESLRAPKDILAAALKKVLMETSEGEKGAVLFGNGAR